jgi:GrxC family glutaredoxin
MEDKKMNQITIYTKGYCPYCKAAKKILASKGWEYTEIDVEHDQKAFSEMTARSRRRTVPQIFFDGEHIGGFDDLQRYLSLENDQVAA